jgi:hypothetical protein
MMLSKEILQTVLYLNRVMSSMLAANCISACFNRLEFLQTKFYMLPYLFPEIFTRNYLLLRIVPCIFICPLFYLTKITFTQSVLEGNSFDFLKCCPLVQRFNLDTGCEGS